MNLKEGDISLPGAIKAPLFDAGGMNAIDAEIRAPSPGCLITPDEVQGKHATLREAVAAGGWPTLRAARGKVMFALDCPPGQAARYRETPQGAGGARSLREHRGELARRRLHHPERAQGADRPASPRRSRPA